MTARLLSGSRELQPEDLDTQVRRAAAAMANSGVKPGDAVALLLRNDFAFFVSSLAARWIGAFAVPINWHSTPSEVAYILQDCSAALLVGHNDLLAPLGDLRLVGAIIAVSTPPEIANAYGLSPAPRPTAAIAWDDWLGSAASEPPALQSAATSPMIYTSGTTGRPKGVRRAPLEPDQQSAQQRTLADAYGLRPGDAMTVLMTGPMYHSAPNSYGLAAGSLAQTIVLQPRFDAEDLLDSVQRFRVTHMHVVPTMFIRLLKLPEELKAKYDLSSLRFVVHGAAPCPVEVKRQMISWWGPVIHEYYGSTETGLITAHGSADALARPGTVGRALPGVDVRVLTEDGAAAPVGEIGDIYLRTQVMPDFTYHGRECERTSIQHDDLITVGDVGWLDEKGFLFICDRRRDMIISGGVNIYPAEVEAVLLAFDGVRDCAVFGIPDEEFGEAVCAWIEPQPGMSLDATSLRGVLSCKLSRFKIPKVIEFSPALPREDSGKVFKRRLREPYWTGAGRSI